jgi:hypothetical protein
MAEPLWFLGMYVLITAATPILVRIDRRWGLAAPVAMMVAVGILDFLRWGPIPVPAWVGWLALAPGWVFAFQLGVAWARRPYSRGQATGLLAGGAALATALFTIGGYPLTMVGGAGLANRSNTHPPSLVMLALEAFAVGALLRWESSARRVLSIQTLAATDPARPSPTIPPPTIRGAARQLASCGRAARVLASQRLAATLARINRAPVTILTWHQAAAMAPALLVALMVPGLGIPGLTQPPGSPGWLWARLAWMAAFAVILRWLRWVTAAFESASPRDHRPRQASRSRGHRYADLQPRSASLTLDKEHHHELVLRRRRFVERRPTPEQQPH